eukprot:CAMPEP_0181327760 /NCGR_PEP_ID=MMETSP1101-20121128/22292_1 /TAXON_ID=46948 /ORGANISM="Rhodomonas abbreviata, Strain Caron Lab Isolate" /LENGTH=206 /DNA_ID=CAMNT_0023436479 /DNA_START=399 /DNA_END=1020 /DNA_ORIENTATION=+
MHWPPQDFRSRTFAWTGHHSNGKVAGHAPVHVPRPEDGCSQNGTAALDNGHEQAVQDVAAADINVALLKVAFRGLDHLIPPLIEAGADINHMALRHSGAPMELVGLTPLSAASHQGHVSAVKLLLGLGACPVAADKDERVDGGTYSSTKKSKYAALWREIARTVAAKRRAVKMAEHAKSIPYVGNNRRTPGRRKTRHAKGARGANN